MSQTVGVCGYHSSGSSAVSDLLNEFEEVQVFDNLEFVLVQFPDGLKDLDDHLNQYSHRTASFAALTRFRTLMGSPFALFANFNRETNGKIMELTEDFLGNIVQVKWHGFYPHMNQLCAKKIWLFARYFYKRSARLLNKKNISPIWFSKLYDKLFSQNMEFSMFPENFDYHAHNYINNILKEMGQDPDKITVLDQPFRTTDPVSCFKYFDSPKAIIVNRDPRDQYLFAKNFLSRQAGSGKLIPVSNVEDFIKFYKIIHQSPPGLIERDDVLAVNFESLIYDYENSVKRIADFLGITQHTRRKKVFDPMLSRNNTQLFNKYTEYTDDIKKIESALPGFLFPFEKYPDVEAKGSMFFGQSPLHPTRKKR